MGGPTRSKHAVDGSRSSEPSSASVLRWALALGAGSSLVLIAIFVAAWAWFKTPLAFFRPADDAYYYFDVASHVVHHGTFSTDMLHTTNGFHPLWFVVLMPFAAVFEAPSQGLVVSAQLISCLCFGVAVAGIAATARRGGLTPFAAALGALALFVPDWRGIVGAIVEGGLTLALLSWMAFAALRLRDRLEEGIAGTRDGVLVGLLAGCAILARLDAVWTVGAVCLLVTFWISRSGNAASITRPLALAVLGIPAALLGVYVVANVAATGHVVPISGQIKSSFPTVDFSSTYLRQYKLELLLLAVAAVALVVARLQSSRLFGLLLALTVGGAVQSAYVLLFVPQAVFWWYFVTLLPAGLLGLAVLIDAVVTKPWVRKRPALLVVAGVAAALDSPRADRNRASREIFRWQLPCRFGLAGRVTARGRMGGQAPPARCCARDGRLGRVRVLHTTRGDEPRWRHLQLRIPRCGVRGQGAPRDAAGRRALRGHARG